MSRLFGTSGIRGTVHEEITPSMMLGLAGALGTRLKNSGTVAIGRDVRTSSEMLEGCFVSGLLSSGCSVAKLGMVPTPAVSFAIRKLESEAGAMITASHNPPEYNGIKLFESDGTAYAPEDEDEIERIYFEKKFETISWENVGAVGFMDVLPDYIDEISHTIELNRKFKVAVDCSNGATSTVTPHLLEELGCEVVTINSRPDGTFPGHPPEPTEENLKDLCKLVKSTGADVGLAHDGDGDRIAAVDDRGRVVPNDKLLALAGAHVARKFDGKVVTTVDASKIVENQVTSAGGSIVRTMVGDVSVARKMKSQGSRFGGEPSGAWIFGDVHLCPDGPLAGARILEMMADAGNPLSEMVDEIPSYPIVRSKLGCPNERKEEVMKSVGKRIPSKLEGVKEVTDVDGIRLDLDDGSWILIRPSGTEPYIRITTEAVKKKRARTLLEEAEKTLLKLVKD